MIYTDRLSVSGQESCDSDGKEEEFPPAQKKQKSNSKKSTGKGGKFQKYWSLPPQITSSSKGNTYMHTVGCAQVISPSHMEVTTMLNGMLRVQCISKDLKDSSGSSSIGSFFRENTTTHTREVTLAEVRMVQFIARHNISFQAADHLSQLFPILFPDSKIAASFGCGHTKTKAICCDALDPHFKKPVIGTAMTQQPFSLLCDESNDKGSQVKLLTILIRLYDAQNGLVVTRSP